MSVFGQGPGLTIGCHSGLWGLNYVVQTITIMVGRPKKRDTYRKVRGGEHVWQWENAEWKQECIFCV